MMRVVLTDPEAFAVRIGLEEVLRLYAQRGCRQYGGEAVNQLEHACQCAALAEAAGAPETLVAAAFLHDFGHLLADRARAADSDTDDLHQYLALPVLRGWLPESVLGPIALHVDAKRYLCRAEPAYHEALSPASRRSLALQGEAFSDAQAAAFLGRRYAAEAVRLRRWDDCAKQPAQPTPGIAHYAASLRRVALA